MKTKIIKNSACIFVFILILVAFFVYYGTNPSEVAVPYILPAIMLEFLICIFSFFWSLKKRDKISNWNINLIVFLVCSVFVLIVVEAINTVAVPTSSMKEVLSVLNYIFYVIIGLGCLFCISYPIYLDFLFQEKKIEEKK
jgi:Na+/melibiose symporter-like transporter